MPPWILTDFAHILDKPLCAIFNSTVKESYHQYGNLQMWCHTKKHPPQSIENDIRPVSLTPTLAKVFKSRILEWVNMAIEDKLDLKQF